MFNLGNSINSIYKTICIFFIYIFIEEIIHKRRLIITNIAVFPTRKEREE